MAVDKLPELADQVKAGATTGRVAMERGGGAWRVARHAGARLNPSALGGDQRLLVLGPQAQ